MIVISGVSLYGGSFNQGFIDHAFFYNTGRAEKC